MSNLFENWSTEPFAAVWIRSSSPSLADFCESGTNCEPTKTNRTVHFKKSCRNRFSYVKRLEHFLDKLKYCYLKQTENEVKFKMSIIEAKSRLVNPLLHFTLKHYLLFIELNCNRISCI